MDISFGVTDSLEIDTRTSNLIPHTSFALAHIELILIHSNLFMKIIIFNELFAKLNYSIFNASCDTAYRKFNYIYELANSFCDCNGISPHEGVHFQ